MFWKYLLLSYLLLERTINGQPSPKLTKVTIRDPEALCNDNTRAAFYVRLQSSKNWVIFFESGGLCSSKESCNERYLDKNSSVLMTSTSLPDGITGRDILSTLEGENPKFRSYNHVLVPYCSSDLWLGEKTSLNKPFTFVNDSSVDNFSFRGKTIFRSLFEELRKNFSISIAEQIILAGSSAGAIGVMNNAEWILNNFIKSHGLKARVLTILDSSWFINFQDSFKSRVNPAFAMLANITFDACKDMSYGYSCCLSSACMLARGYFPSAVPVLFVFSLYDIYMFADVLKNLEDQGKTPEDHPADFLSVVSMYGGAMNESLTLSASHVLNISFFVPACFQHTYFSTSSLWDEDDVLHPLVEVTRGTGKFTHRIQSGTWISTRINNGTEMSLQQFISTWVESDFSRSSLIDSCIGAHCNPTCPDKLVFIDSGVVWHDTVKAIVIGLSLVITLLCIGLKSSFIAYYNYLTWKQNQYFDDSETCQARRELPLTRTDEAISIACLSLTYHVDIKKQKKPSPDTEKDSEDDAVVTETGRNASGSFKLRDSITEASTGDYYQDFDTDRDDTNMEVGHDTKLDIAEESMQRNPRKERLESFTSADGDSTWEPASAIHNLLQDTGSGSCLTPRSSDKNKASGPLKKQILKGVSAYFNTGELVAIMGPSGCGKTTFLDLLTGRRRHGDCKGQVYINGVALGDIQDWYACKIGYVLQLAVPYYEELTVRQNLFFAAHMRLDRGKKASEKFERVEQILAETGLTSLAETEVGGAKGLGLSGGQKRRLCVALQMIHMPSVLFLDEPTSGLDATSSLELLNHLNLVAESGRLVILTIHQPRLEIFHLFHKILLLCDGQVAYYGEPSMAPAIFLKAYAESTTEEFRLSDAAPKIDAKNPADTIMDLLNCSQARRAILDYYQRSGEPQAVQEAINTAQKKATETLTMSKIANIDDGAGSFNRIFVLESRAAERQTLGQILYFPVIFFMFGIIIGTVYWHAEDREGILLMSAYCVYCCASPLFLSSVLMAHLNKALEIFHLEREDGCGRSYENVIQTFARATALCVFPVIVCSTMSYFMVMTEYDLWKFILVTIISLVLNQTWIAVYMMVICAQPQIAHRICPMVSAIGGFAGGFLVPRPQMPVVYNLLFYINPQFYGYSAITKVLLLNVRLKCEYESTLNCISTDGNAVLSRFGFDKVNPYKHVVIMLAMTVLSLILAWLFLEAKYVNLRVLTKRTLKLSHVKVPEDFETGPEQANDTPSKDTDEDEYVPEDIQFPEDIAISPFTRNRRSAKSRLGLISKNQGFHTVKLPNQRKRPALGGSVFYPKQDGADREVEFEDAARPSAVRVTSASKRELWKCTRQRMEEQKLNFNEQMTQVQNLAKRFSIHHYQSLRQRAREKASAPRRSTMATAGLCDSRRSHLTRKHDASSPNEYALDLVSEEVKNPREVRKETEAVDMGDVFNKQASYKDENDTTEGSVEDLNQTSRTGLAELAGTDNNNRADSNRDQSTGKDSSQPAVTTREPQRTRTGSKPKKTILKPRTDRASLADSTGSQESLSSQAEENVKKKGVSIALCEITDVIDV